MSKRRFQSIFSEPTESVRRARKIETQIRRTETKIRKLRGELAEALAEAHNDDGWSYRQLGATVGYSHENVRKLVKGH